jgi:hypothetical protein
VKEFTVIADFQFNCPFRDLEKAVSIVSDGLIANKVNFKRTINIRKRDKMENGDKKMMVGTSDQCHCLQLNLTKFPYLPPKRAQMLKFVNRTGCITSSSELCRSTLPP